MESGTTEDVGFAGGFGGAGEGRGAGTFPTRKEDGVRRDSLDLGLGSRGGLGDDTNEGAC